MEAKKKSNASFVWNSLMWGKELLDKGVRWRVGNGKSIQIYRDKWLPKPSTFLVSSRPALNEDATVDSLMTTSGGWNAQLLKSKFLQFDVEEILRIPVGGGNQDDSLVWHFDGSGEYTVKSGYWVDRNIASQPSSSNPNCINSWWAYFWKIQIPLKVKIFAWKAYHDWIPTKYNTARRGVQTDGLCDICKGNAESTIHALWDCNNLKGIRKEWNTKFGAFTGQSNNFSDLIYSCTSYKNANAFGLFCIIIWRIWFCRNANVHEGRKDYWNDVFGWSEQYLKDFLSSRQRVGQTKKHQSCKAKAVWLAPGLNIYKANCDAIVDKTRGVTGLGIVIRDSKGEVFASCTQIVEANPNGKASKLMAMIRSIHFVLDCGLEPCTFETDDATIVKWIKEGSHRSSDYGVLLNDISYLCRNLKTAVFEYIPKRANMVARGLANAALETMTDTFWMEEFPSCIKNLVEADKPM